MGTNNTRPLVEEYARVLKSFGLSLGEIGDLHGLPPGSVLDPNALGAAIREEEGLITEDRLHRQLLDVLGRSSRGFEADRHYWNRLPTVQLGEVLGAAGYRFGVRTRTPGHEAVCTTEDEPIDLGLWQSGGGPVSHTTFEYPDTPLGDDNYPALVAAVDRELLDGTGLTFVLLEDRCTDWQFALLPTDLLRMLRERYGDRIEWRGRPLLRAAQPPAFEDGVPECVDLEWDPEAEQSASDESISRPTSSFDEVSASTTAQPGALAFDHGDGEGPSPDSLASAADPTDLVTDGAGGATATGASAAAVEFFEGIGEKPDVVAAQPATGGSTTPQATEWHTEPRPDDSSPQDVDEVFEELERAAAEEPVDGADADDHYVPSSEVLDRIDHENVGANSRIEDGFVWVDPEELTATPWEVHDAMTRG